MTIIALTNGDLSARVSTRGGSILRLDQGEVPLLRPAADNAAAIDSGCYPLVPFGNRIRGNGFDFDGRRFTLTPNTEWDAHYLHGEGWLSEWSVEQASDDAVVLAHAHEGSALPYSYRAEQKFALRDGGFEMQLSVTNTGARPMPFGIGWHPYFPMTPQTELQTQTGAMWSEEEGWLPGAPGPVPADLDFSQPAPLPHRWVNNGFEDWSGQAVIRWPERNAALEIAADPLFDAMFLFVSDTSFDPSYKRDFFALEPMSHLADGHNMPDLGGLRVLEPGETLGGGVVLTPRSL
ncbi:aldose 1-epimerase [Salipiger mangrovisoli]|uniref:Aldose 1-epimerase n=1 Tax=Salipiger mangrovisoli TaxID=2865933 RepID=A0ABR9X8B9_9RHOB|nr:aldose 1-epimerase [Salipiger mangrovisoli]MBE9639792.1 aldose 1-epimerase [Salipiger mangrovisoli]